MDPTLGAHEWHKRFSNQLKWTSQLRNYIYEKIDFSKFNNLLEVGCGTGALLLEISQKFRHLELFGIDIDEKRLKVCEENLQKNQNISRNTNGKKIQLHVMDICYNVYPDEAFDAIITNLVLLWVKDLDKTFEQIYRLLKKNGIFIIFTEPDYGGMIEYPETGSKQALIKNLEENGADPCVSRKIGKFIKKYNFKMVEKLSPSVPWLASINRDGLLAELEFFKKILSNSFDSEKMRISIENGEYFLYNPSFSFILQK
ncbi:MAG: class I SAM-dependent methyltransferase [archaeon]|nr:class I SAM-dependent methyltransferase [archaeon]